MVVAVCVPPETCQLLPTTPSLLLLLVAAHPVMFLLFTLLLLPVVGGVVYCFGLWSPLLKKNYGLSQGTLELIGAAHNLGGYSSFVSGLVYDALEHRHHVGPRLSLVMGSLVNLVGFFLLWAAVTKRFEASIWQLVVLSVFAGNGGTWYDTSPLTTNLRNFPASRGTVVGLVKACIGLSASLYTAWYNGYFLGDPGAFMLFLAFVPSIVTLCLMPLVNFVPYLQKSELSKQCPTETRFYMTLKIIATLSIYLMVTALVTGLTDVSNHVRAWMAIGSVLFLVPLVAVPIDSGGLYSEKATLFHLGDQEAVDYEDGDTTAPRHNQGRIGDGEASVDGTSIEDIAIEPSPIPSLSLKQCLPNVNFWILATTCGIGIGSGLAFLNNSAQIVVALGGPASMRSILVTFFGVASCGGWFVGMDQCYNELSIIFFMMNRCFQSCRKTVIWCCTRESAACLWGAQASLLGPGLSSVHY